MRLDTVPQSTQRCRCGSVAVTGRPRMLRDGFVKTVYRCAECGREFVLASFGLPIRGHSR